MTPSYRWLYAISVAVTIVLGVIGAIQVADHNLLGVSDQVVAWLGIIATGLGIGNGFLPRLTKPPNESREGLD